MIELSSLFPQFAPAFTFLLFSVSFGLITQVLKMLGYPIPRLSGLIVVTSILLAMLGFISPMKLVVLLYKLTIVAMFAILGFVVDTLFFPYARPDSYLADPNWRDAKPKVGDANCPIVFGYRLTFNAVNQRRAIIVGCAMIAGALGA